MLSSVKKEFNLYMYDIRHHWNDSHWNRLCAYLIIFLLGCDIIRLFT